MLPPCLPCLAATSPLPAFVLLLLSLPPPQPTATSSSAASAAGARPLITLLIVGVPFDRCSRGGPGVCVDHLAVRGFSASCRPSPTRLKARTVRSSARPGKVMYHQAVSKMSLASEIIWPQLAFGGWMPTPRKDSAAS